MQLGSDDTFRNVYDWYQAAMPAGSQRNMTACMSPMSKNAPHQDVAIFSEGTPDKNYRVAFIMGFPDDARSGDRPQGEKVPRTMIMLEDR
ncbi:MAG: hypothetical protein JO219_05020 [Candidatus Eremiobacteraeota bacterium]|nr:hypothetical protein [Candidatus Eremiobacteraeota bacterium]MBV8366844.1 hypothetical protein [Candidatus Eremiobacteraeota bacterium]